MSTGYVRVYEQLRRRIASGELPVGRQLPGISALEVEYGVSLTTIRAAQQMLVDEGMIVVEQGRGAYVTSTDPVRAVGVETAIADAIVQLQRAQRALEDPGNPPRVWVWVSWRKCSNCGDEGRSTRRWDDGRGYDGYDPTEFFRECGHDIATGVGLIPEVSRAEAVAGESWWESYPHKTEAAEKLSQGDRAEALAHLQAASTIDAQHDNFTGWSSTVTPDQSGIRKGDDHV